MDSNGIAISAHLCLWHGQSKGAKGHQRIGNSSDNHAVGYLTRSRRLFALGCQRTEDSHRDRCQCYDIEGIELLEDRSRNGDNTLAFILQEEECQGCQDDDT